MPKRIQRSRSKGWRMPPGAIYVGRPGKWGNPYQTADGFRRWLEGDPEMQGACEDRRQVILRDIEQLRGHDLACWCPPDYPCHADVLIALANSSESHFPFGD